MTIYAPLTRDLLNPPPLAAVQLLTRQSVTPLSQTPFVRQPELFWEQWEGLALIPGSPTWLKPALLKEPASYLPHAKGH